MVGIEEGSAILTAVLPLEPLLHAEFVEEMLAGSLAYRLSFLKFDEADTASRLFFGPHAHVFHFLFLNILRSIESALRVDLRLVCDR